MYKVLTTYSFVEPHVLYKKTDLPTKFFLQNECEGNPYHLFFWMIARFNFIDTGGELVYYYQNTKNNYLCESALTALPPRFIREQIVDPAYEYVGLPAMIWDSEKGLIQEPWMYEYVKTLFKSLWEHHTQQKGKYTYISRKPSIDMRVVLNESEYRDQLKRLGFSFYYMEDLTFKEQIALFVTSEIILAPHGAALTFALFCAPGSVLMEIHHTQRAKNYPFYYDLARACGLHWILLSKIELIGENYNVDVNDLLQTVRHIVDLRKSH